MSKKRRKRRPRKPPERAEAEAVVPAKPSVRAARRRAANLDERPPAPWGDVPLVELVELVVLLGIVLLIAGFIVGGSNGTVMIAAGAVLCSIAGLELAIREHFGGYRSHTFLLAGAAGVGTLIALALGVPSLWLPIALAIA